MCQIFKFVLFTKDPFFRLVGRQGVPIMTFLKEKMQIRLNCGTYSVVHTPVPSEKQPK